MISNFNKSNKKDNIKSFTQILVILLLITWFATPPFNKFWQLCYFKNCANYYISQLISSSPMPEYVFRQNNSIYYANMYKDKTRALNEINKAFQIIPVNAPKDELQTLYRYRANILLAAEDYDAALNDFMNSGVISYTDNLKVAMLYKLAGNYQKAMSYCNNIVTLDPTVYEGYACIADLYSSLGRYDYALRIWDLAIDRKKSNAKAYVDRARTKKLLGDMNGYNADIKKAKELSPRINIDESLIEETLHPRVLRMTIK